MLYFPKFLLRKIPTATSSMVFSKQFFTHTHTHRIQYLFFIIFESLLFKSLIVTTVEVYKFHALTNRNKKTLQWNYNVIASKLQCDSFKLPKKVLLTFSDEAIHFILLRCRFFTLSGKTNGVQTNAGHDNTEHALATNFACIFL